ncbi:MAG: hypothetical protein EAZ06_01250 [Cytophagales bacterium]|nr:MAG: hypothetical protein EAY69_04060 [Cytophagales bacterium]TAH30964.1 MAG: hypothetical protein EAZ06_01250 [Cytophagales bacterium]
MKLISLKLTNFKKISNIADNTIYLNEDINILVGGNNTGKTSILQAVQKLFGTKNIEPKDLNYLVKNGNLKIEGNVRFSEEEVLAFFEIAKNQFEHQVTNQKIQEIAKEIASNNSHFFEDLTFIERKNAQHSRNKSFSSDILKKYAKSQEQDIYQIIFRASTILNATDFYNIYKSPLYLDSRGNLMEKEKFIPLNEIENQFKNQNNQVNIRGLLYALKKKKLDKFKEFKKRLLNVFSELEDVDVIHNEDIGEFELILKEKLRNNGTTEQVTYDIKDVGQGMQSLVLILATILLLKPHIVLMDEPEAHMHPSLINEFVKYLKYLAKDTQFIITSHSLVLMNEVGMDKIFHLKNDVAKKGIVINKIEERNNFLDIIKEIGYDIDTLSYIAQPCVYVFVEGESDKKYLLEFAKKANLQKQINVFNIGFVIMGGKNNRHKFLNLLEKLEKNILPIPFVMILDKDETSEENIQKFKAKIANTKNEIYYLEKRQIENYLIDMEAIKRIITKKIKPENQEKWEQINFEKQIIEFCESQKEHIFNNYISDFFANSIFLSTQKMREIFKDTKQKNLQETMDNFAAEFSGELTKITTKKGIELSKNTSSMEDLFNQKWENEKMNRCDGRKLIKNIRFWLETEFQTSFSDQDIIDEMIMPDEITKLLGLLSEFNIKI